MEVNGTETKDQFLPIIANVLYGDRLDQLTKLRTNPISSSRYAHTPSHGTESTADGHNRIL